MSKTYIILALILIALSFGLFLLPEQDRTSELSPELLLQKINNPSRYLSPDLIAERLINEDPSIMLVDIRMAYEYESYSLPGAVCIPIDEIAEPMWENYLDAENMDIVLFSNSDVLADQAWVIGTRMGYTNLYVMDGGLNRWFNEIMQPKAPSATSPKEAFELYAFRKGACQYFGGGTALTPSNGTSSKPVQLIKRTKKVVAEGGC